MNIYQPNIAVIGPSGSGKSSSIQNLDPETTGVIDTELKGFPFKTKFPNAVSIENFTKFYEEFDKMLANPKLKVIVIDSMTKHIENALNFCRSAYKNFDIWSNFNMHIRNSVNKCKSRDKVIVTMHIDELTEVVSPEGTKSNVRRAATLAGKEWDGKLEKEFLMVFYTDVRKNAINVGKMKHSFLTNSDGVCSAKSPQGMFNELLIPNDLKMVIETAQEYYK